MKAKEMVGMTIRGTTDHAGIPASRTVEDVHRNAQDGLWYAWSVDSRGHGEHIRAGSEIKLIQRINALR
jgi:hypothetical protein